MAVTFTGAGVASAASGGSPQNVTTTTAFAAGDYLVVLMAYDNSGGGGADPMSGTFNTPAFAAPYQNALGASVSAQTGLNDPGAASAGLAVRCVAYPVTAAVPSGTVFSAYWSGTVVVRAMALGKVSSAGITGYRQNSGATGTNAVAATTASFSPGGTTATNDLLLCWAAHENGAAITGDADTTGGTWSAVYGTFTGSAQTGMAAYFQSKLLTSGATQTFNPTGTLSDWIIGSLTFTETPIPAITQAAYQFFDDAGTESGAASLGALNTGITGLLTGADGYGVLRVRLQSTTAVAVPSTDDFQLQWAKEVAPATLADSYSDTNYSGFTTLTGGYNRGGQSFMGNGQRLTQARFKLVGIGTPPGILTAWVYAHTGTFGSTGTGTGSPLATSTNTIAGNTVSGTAAWYSFSFDGSLNLANGTPYVLVIGTSVAGDGSNAVRLLLDSTAPTHAGNQSAMTDAGVFEVGTNDVIFEIYTNGTWTDITTVSTPVQGAFNPNLTAGGATTNRLGAGTGTFVAGKISLTGDVPNMGWTANNYTEVVYSLRLVAAQLAADDVLRFRVIRNGVTTEMTYTVTPTITIKTPIAVAGSTSGVSSTVAALNVAANPPAAPTSLVATPGSTQVALTWIAPPGPVTDYVVQYRPTAIANWQDLLYDYWDASQAVGSSPLASAKGLVPNTLPVSTVTADGFMLTTAQNFANTNPSIGGVVAVVKADGLNTGWGVGLVFRECGAGWSVGINIDWASPPNYVHCPFEAGPNNGPAGRDVARSLFPGDTGIYASGRTGSYVACRIVPDNGPGLYESTSGAYPPVGLRFGLASDSYTYNLRYKMVGVTEGAPSAELMDALATAFLPISGGTVTEFGGYRYHTFTTSGTLKVLAPIDVEYLVSAGGGGGGHHFGGGGGAGGVVIGSTILSAGSTTVTIGNGGIGGVYPATDSLPGQDSLLGSIIAKGGGGGGSRPGLSSNGGSGGGGGNQGTTAPGTGIAGQGYAGGPGYDSALILGGGGGGGGQIGGPDGPPPAHGAAPGKGYRWLNGAIYGTGGKGTHYSARPLGGQMALRGGVGGDGGQSAQNGWPGVAGTVVVRIPIEAIPATPATGTGGNSIVDNGGYRYHIFTTSGNFQVTKSGVVDVMLVTAGGGGGYHFGAGGGGGMYEIFTDIAVRGTESVAVIVGAGGVGGTGATMTPNGGNISSFGPLDGTIGGGGGGGRTGSPIGHYGACGGGGGNGSSELERPGRGIYGYGGGIGYGDTGASSASGGGGGLGSTGGAASVDTGGTAGAGVASPWIPATIGTICAGGKGNTGTLGTPANPTTMYGEGGMGGGPGYNGAPGGNGLVVVRYLL